jgi:hypothetical protein
MVEYVQKSEYLSHASAATFASILDQVRLELTEIQKGHQTIANGLAGFQEPRRRFESNAESKLAKSKAIVMLQRYWKRYKARKGIENVIVPDQLVLTAIKQFRPPSPSNSRGLFSQSTKERAAAMMDSFGLEHVFTQKERFTVHPEGALNVSWIVFGVLLIIYEFFLIPYHIAFEYCPSPQEDTVNAVIVTFFIADIFFNFNVGFFDSKQQKLVFDRRLIAFNYLRSWFWVDFIAAVPFDKLVAKIWTDGQEVECGTKSPNHLFRLAKWFKFIRLARLFKLQRKVATFESTMLMYSNALEVFSIVRTILSILFMGHISSCVWWYAGRYNEVKGDANWIEANVPEEYRAARLSANPTAFDHVWEYLYAFHFVMATFTTVGYGDITPTKGSDLELILTQVFQLIGSITFAIILGLLTSFFMELYSASQKRKREGIELINYLAWRNVPESTNAAIRRAFHFKQEHRGMDVFEEQVMDKLGYSLRAKLAYTIYGELLQEAPFLAWMKDFKRCIMELSLSCVTTFYDNQSILFQAGSVMLSIHFLLKGSTSIHHVSQTTDVDDGEKLTTTLSNTIGALASATTSGQQGFKVPRGGKKKPQRVGEAAKAIAVFATQWGKVNSSEEHELDPARDMWEYAEQQLARKHLARVIYLPNQQEVHAPAYFGESCLWNSEAGNYYQYTPVCTSKVECAVLAKSGIEELLLGQPVLVERFETFRRKVRRELMQATATDHHEDRFMNIVGSTVLTERQSSNTAPERTVSFRPERSSPRGGAR